MGQHLSSPQEQPSQESVINLSDSLLYRLTDEEEPENKDSLEDIEDITFQHGEAHKNQQDEQGTQQESQGQTGHGKERKRKHINILDEIPHDVEERRHMQELKAKDDVHSITYGITVKHFDELLKKVSDQVEPMEEVCPRHELINCLQHNKKCMTHCRPAMDHFIECVDTYRINVIKDLIACENDEKKKIRKQDEDKLGGFLKEIQLEEES